MSGMAEEKIPLLVLVGPTGVGKSHLAQRLALRLDTAVVHADSRQVYRKMNIGTAKPGRDMLKAAPHYLLDVAEPDEPFSAGRYREMAAPVIERLRREGRLPLVEGGTGLYIRALVDGLFDGPPADQKIRRRLRRTAREMGEGFLYERLREVDPAAAARLHPHDTLRIIRALEVYELTGVSLSLQRRNIPPPRYKPIFFGLTAERMSLYRRINERAESMFREGLVKEVAGLLHAGYHEGLNSMRGLGYREVIGHLRGKYDLERALYLLQRNTRRYAKRQLTWFRADKRVEWLCLERPGSSGDLVDEVIRRLRGRGFPPE